MKCAPRGVTGDNIVAKATIAACSSARDAAGEGDAA